jgi:hypothetical protein
LDAHAAAITTADIVAIRVDTGIRYHSATDSAGRFAVDLLPPGEYSARAEAEGMLPQISPVLRVEIGVATQLTFKLKVAGPKETTTAAERAQVYGSVAAGARSDAGSVRLDAGIERRPCLWWDSGI